MTDSFTNVFGGSPVQPSQVAYRNIALAASVTLFWPQQTVDTVDIIARWNDVTPASGGLAITLGPATSISLGQDAAFSNIGINTFTILANDATTIATVAPGEVLYLINTDNSTTAGSWRTVVFGATTSSASAAALAGAGLIAAGTLINQNWIVSPHNSNYTVVANDLATMILWTGGAGTVTLPDPATVGGGFFIQIDNQGTGALTVTPAAGFIDGAASKTYNQTENSIINTDGSNYYSIGFGRSATVTFSQLVKSVAGGTDVTLTAAEAANQVQQYTGLLTGNINVIVPTNVAEYFVFNNTTGAFSLTVKTVAGSGVTVPQGNRNLLICDGTNVVPAISAGGGTVTSVGTGTGLTGGPITTSGTISLGNTTVTPGSYVNTGITVDAQGRITSASSGAGASGITSVVVQSFTANNTYTPTTGMLFCLVYACGGGGAGGGAAATGVNQSSVGSGGASASWVNARFTAAQIGASKVVGIGAAGIAVSGASGGAGGTTTLGALLSCPGGGGGLTGGPSGVNFVVRGGQAPGGVTGGFVNSSGEDGDSAITILTSTNGTMGGRGGSGPFGAGGGGPQTGAGEGGRGNGSGGGGGANSSSMGAKIGGNGSVGAVFIVEFVA